jgi:hypothetical protein
MTVHVLIVTSWIMLHKHKCWPSNEALMQRDMFLFTCFKWHNKARVMFSQNRGQMWCITISSKRGGNIKGPYFTFGIDSWIFGVSKGCHVEPSKGTSKLVKFISTFWTFQTFTNLMILCSDQTDSFSNSLWHVKQIIHKMNIKVSQIVRFSILWPFNRSTPRTTVVLLHSHWKETYICYVRREVLKTCYWFKPCINGGFNGK